MQYTISGPDLQAALGVTPQSIVRWFKNNHDGHPPYRRDGKTIFYRLRDVVVRLRHVRPRGLYGDELSSIVAQDAERRCEAPLDDIHVGEDPEGVSALLRALTHAETERLRDIRVAFRHTCAACGLTPDLYINRLVLHPGIFRFVLTGDEAEIPTLYGWPSFTRAFCAANPAPHPLPPS